MFPLCLSDIADACDGLSRQKGRGDEKRRLEASGLSRPAALSGAARRRHREQCHAGAHTVVAGNWAALAFRMWPSGLSQMGFAERRTVVSQR